MVTTLANVLWGQPHTVAATWTDHLSVSMEGNSTVEKPPPHFRVFL